MFYGIGLLANPGVFAVAEEPIDAIILVVQFTPENNFVIAAAVK